jgi:hypothetical protein
METKHDQPRRGTYEDLKMMPGTLVKLVVQGKAKVIGKDDYGRLIYELGK